MVPDWQTDGQTDGVTDARARSLAPAGDLFERASSKIVKLWRARSLPHAVANLTWTSNAPEELVEWIKKAGGGKKGSVGTKEEANR